MTEVVESGYARRMDVATSRVEVGVRELKNHLSRYLGRVRDGEEVVVTDHGRPVARLVAIDASSDRLNDLVRSGLVRPARSARGPLPRPVRSSGTVSDAVADQRR